MDVGGSAALVAWLRERDRRGHVTAELATADTRRVAADGASRVDGLQDDGHGYVIGTRASSLPVSGRMTEVQRLRAELDELPDVNGWARP